MSFEKQIQEWVTLDNQIKSLNAKLKELRDIRSNNEVQIFSYAEKHKLNQSTINITDGALKIVSVKQTAPLTLRYVAECLEKCIKNVKEYIKKLREHEL